VGGAVHRDASREDMTSADAATANRGIKTRFFNSNPPANHTIFFRKKPAIYGNNINACGS